jgi:hypothetical protein
VNAGSGASEGDGVMAATLAGLSLASEVTGITAGLTGAGRSQAANTTVNRSAARTAPREIVLMCESVLVRWVYVGNSFTIDAGSSWRCPPTLIRL